MNCTSDNSAFSLRLQDQNFWQPATCSVGESCSTRTKLQQQCLCLVRPVSTKQCRAALYSVSVLIVQHASFKIYVNPFCFVLFNCFCFLLLNSTAITICPLTAVSQLSESETNCVCASFAGLLFCPAICATYKEICLATYIVAEICSFLSSAC